VQIPPTEIPDDKGNMVSVKDYYTIRKQLPTNKPWVWDAKKDAMIDHFNKVETQIDELEDQVIKCDEKISDQIQGILDTFIQNIHINDKKLSKKEVDTLDLSLKMTMFRSIVDSASGEEDLSNFQVSYAIS